MHSRPFGCEILRAILFVLVGIEFGFCLSMSNPGATVPATASPTASTRFDPIIPLSGKDFEHVYEPSEDSFLFMDALGKEMSTLREMRATVVLEIG
jgi:hypothetical protein